MFKMKRSIFVALALGLVMVVQASDVELALSADYNSNGDITKLYSRCSLLVSKDLSRIYLFDTDTDKTIGIVEQSGKNTFETTQYGNIVVSGSIDCSESSDGCKSGEYAFVKVDILRMAMPADKKDKSFGCRAKGDGYSWKETKEIQVAKGLTLSLKGTYDSNKDITKLSSRCSFLAQKEAARVYLFEPETDYTIGIVQPNGVKKFESTKFGNIEVSGSLDCTANSEGCNDGETAFVKVDVSNLKLGEGGAYKQFGCRAKSTDDSGWRKDNTIQVANELYFNVEPSYDSSGTLEKLRARCALKVESQNELSRIYLFDDASDKTLAISEPSGNKVFTQSDMPQITIKGSYSCESDSTGCNPGDSAYVWADISVSLASGDQAARKLGCRAKGTGESWSLRKTYEVAVAQPGSDGR